MNQTCKVCGEPAAGFHFGAFTCEGCKSFFGRSYNNVSSITECKNNGECVINKKNRTACKACRLRKCLRVGMSKSGSRYGRRSNWFKIHCLLQEQQQHQQQQTQQSQIVTNSKIAPSIKVPHHQRSPPTSLQHQQHQLGMAIFGQQYSAMHLPRTHEELLLLGLEEYQKNSGSPLVSSPESHNSDNSVEVSDARRLPLFPNLIPPAFLASPGLFLPGYPSFNPALLAPMNNNSISSNNNNNNNNNRLIGDHNLVAEAFHKRVALDIVLQSQRSPTISVAVTPPRESPPPVQSDPIDLSMKGMSERGTTSPNPSERSENSVATERGANSDEIDEESDCDSVAASGVRRPLRTTPLDLTTKV